MTASCACSDAFRLTKKLISSLLVTSPSIGGVAHSRLLGKSRRRKVIMKRENDKRKLCEPRLTPDFPHHEHQHDDNSFECGNFRLIFFHFIQTTKIIHRRGNYFMIRDSGEIFSNTNNFHCAPTCHREISVGDAMGECQGFCSLLALSSLARRRRRAKINSL